MLTDYINDKLRQKELLLMSHIVIGYPDISTSRKLLEVMIQNGVDLVELQIPFSEPIADGPVIMKACQQSLDNGTSVRQCLDFAKEVTRQYHIPFLFMTYYNIIFRRGIEQFADDMVDAGIKGAIVPDLPLEESTDYVRVMTEKELNPIFIYSPNSPTERMAKIAENGKGFIYCSSRKGVTGKDTNFSDSFEEYVSRCRAATELPLAVGFGIKSHDDLDYLKGKADIAVVGTKILQLLETGGLDAVENFFKSYARETALSRYTS